MALRRTILLTGAAGVVGRAIAAQLEGDCVALVHDSHEVPEAAEVLVGDLSAPRLGLSQVDWRRLASTVTAIVHSGALTEWGQPRERYEVINVGGTRHVIELAQAAGAPVHFISTIFVLALQHSRAALKDDNVVRNYIWSKLESERLLQASDVPHTIFRPTNLIGNSQTGASLRPQIVQALSDFIVRGKAPYFPSHPENLVDIAPLDYLAIPVARMADNDLTGGTFHISYGDSAMSVHTALEVLQEHARDTGRQISQAAVVDPREPLPVPLDEIKATSRPFVKVGIDVSEVTFASGGVLPSSLEELRERFDLPDTSPRVAFERGLKYWAQQRGQLMQDASAR